MKYGLLCLVLGCFTYFAKAQFTIKGNIYFQEDKKPVPSASVFFSNTSYGTATNSEGQFVFPNLPAGKLDLIITYIGYETVVKTIDIAQASQQPVTIYIKAKPKELQEVVVGGYEKQTWEKWGKFFLNNFIGTSSFAEDCSIDHTDKIQFRFYKKQNILRAFCDDEIVMTNKALGYTIKYKMELFEYDFKKNLLLYEGYPLFQEMDSKKDKQQTRWIKNRQKAYLGSIMHFMRSLYRNRITQEGFEIRRMWQDSNYEKKRVRNIMFPNAKSLQGGNIHIGSNVPKDSSDYYYSVLRQRDMVDHYSPYTLTGDSVAYAVDSVTAGLQFNDYLYITYTKAKEDNEYLSNVLNNSRGPRAPSSTLTIINDSMIYVLFNGYYFKSLSLLNGGYWSWSEKMARMLPFNYQPPKE